jgi:drug/metabolite transporter (DMT)-like permease
LDGNGYRKLKWANVLGIFIRPFINVSFQISIILAFNHADIAGLNSGVITSMFSTYCIFTSFFTWVVFGEKLQLKFVFGIFLLICGVAFISLSSFSSTNNSGERKIEVYYALGFGLLAPFLISISITVARYFTQHH